MLLILTAVIILSLQIIVSANENKEYIVKLKSDIQLFSCTEEMKLEPLIPKLGLYTVEDISDLDFDMCDYVEEDAPVELFDSYDYSSIMMQGEYSITGIKSMWDIGVYGKDVRVGVVDSGCNPHQALMNNLCNGANFADDSEGTNDNIGHGTAVSGIIAAEYGGSDKVIGKAHKTNIIPLKFFDKDTDGNIVGGTTKRLANAIISAVDDFQCDIINISSGTIDSNTLKLAIDYAVSKGAIIVAAVGNDGNSKSNYPAAYDNVIGVGSVNNSKEHSYFSNNNSSVLVTAPGEDINILSDTTSTITSSGTSFSAPYVSGIIADMREINSDLTLQEAMDIIAQTSEDLGEDGYDEVFGYGVIRADKIIDYMLDEYICYTSGIDLCPTDNFSEIRFRFSNTQNPRCIFAEYINGRLNQLDWNMQYVSDNVFMLRLKKTYDGVFKYFAWKSIESMIPIQVTTGIR